MDQTQVAELAGHLVGLWKSTRRATETDRQPTPGAYQPLGGSTEPQFVRSAFDITGATALESQLFVATVAGDGTRRIVHLDLTEAPAEQQVMANSVLEALHAVARMADDIVGAASVELAPGLTLVRIALLR